jgi:hypothetical protein
MGVFHQSPKKNSIIFFAKNSQAGWVSRGEFLLIHSDPLLLAEQPEIQRRLSYKLWKTVDFWGRARNSKVGHYRLKMRISLIFLCLFTPTPFHSLECLAPGNRNGRPWQAQPRQKAKARRLGRFVQNGNLGHQTDSWQLSAITLPLIAVVEYIKYAHCLHCKVASRIRQTAQNYEPLLSASSGLTSSTMVVSFHFL